MNAVTSALIFIAGVCIICAPSAYSYLDPGTGSYVLQLLAAAVFGGLFVLKMFWSRIKGFFAGIFSRDKKNG